jgi:hypothetical protein
VVSLFIIFRECNFLNYSSKHCSKSQLSPLTVPVKTMIPVQPPPFFATLKIAH